MTYLTNNAWDMRASDKTDVLIEPEHTHQIIKFLGDSQTTFEQGDDNTLILYGPDQGVLVEYPKFPTTRLLLLYYVLISSFKSTLKKLPSGVGNSTPSIRSNADI